MAPWPGPDPLCTNASLPLRLPPLSLPPHHTPPQPGATPPHLTPSACSAILAHPFLAGLADGSLEEQAFKHYVVQDSLYLR